MEGTATTITHVFTDIDGTLLDSAHRLTKRTKDVFAELRARGIRVILVSARPPRGMAFIRDEAGADPYMICCAGALILQGDCIVESKAMPQSVLTRTAEAIAGTAVSLSLYRGMAWYTPRLDPYVLAEADIVHFRPRVLPLKALMDAKTPADAGANKIMLMSSKEVIASIYPKVREAAGQLAAATLSKPDYLEILPPGVDKGSAVRDFCIKHGIDPSKVVCAGDQEVDMGMLRFAGVGIAMGNASEGVKASANRVAPSNDEDGLALALEDLLF